MDRNGSTMHPGFRIRSGGRMLRAHFCVLCGDPLPARGRIDRRYCRTSCRTLAYRHRKQERPGPRGSSPAAGRVDQRASAVELVLRLERLAATTQQELAVARLQLAQLEATKQSQAATAGSPAASQSSPVQQLAQLLHSVHAQVQELRAEMNTLKSTASTPASASPTPPGPPLRAPAPVEQAPPSRAGSVASQPISAATAMKGAPPPSGSPAPAAAPRLAGASPARAQAVAPGPASPAAAQPRQIPPAPPPPRPTPSVLPAAQAVAKPVPPAASTPPEPPRLATIRAQVDVDRLLDRATLATYKRLRARGGDSAAALLIRHEEACRMLGKILITKLWPLLPAVDRTAAARTAYAGLAEKLHVHHGGQKGAVDLLLSKHRRELWLLTRALMRLLERELKDSGLDDAEVDQEVDEDLEQEDGED